MSDTVHRFELRVLDHQLLVHGLVQLTGEPGGRLGRVGCQLQSERVGVGDGIEVAAVGDVDRHRPVRGQGDLLVRQQAERRCSDEGDAGDPPVLDRSGGLDQPGWGVQPDDRLGPGDGQLASLQQRGDGADGVAATHREVAVGFYEERADVGIGPGRRLQHDAAGHVLAARLQYESVPDPVVVGGEVQHLLHHAVTAERRDAGHDQPAGRTGGMDIEDFEQVIGTHGSPFGG